MKKSKVSQVLKELLASRGLSARELSRATGIAQSTVASMLSASKGQHRIEHLATLADYFGVTLDFLAFGEDGASPSWNDALTEGLYEGWLKVKIERAIPSATKTKRNGGGAK